MERLPDYRSIEGTPDTNHPIVFKEEVDPHRRPMGLDNKLNSAPGNPESIGEGESGQPSVFPHDPSDDIW